MNRRNYQLSHYQLSHYQLSHYQLSIKKKSRPKSGAALLYKNIKLIRLRCTALVDHIIHHLHRFINIDIAA